MLNKMYTTQLRIIYETHMKTNYVVMNDTEITFIAQIKFNKILSETSIDLDRS